MDKVPARLPVRVPGPHPHWPLRALPLCRRAWRLTRTLAEGTASLLAAAWRRDPATVRTIFVPLAGAALERPTAVPVLGRMIALSGADEDLARIVMPLLSDALASQTSGADAEVTGSAGLQVGSMLAPWRAPSLSLPAVLPAPEVVCCCGP